MKQSMMLKKFYRHSMIFLATAGGLGFLKPAPGTWGSLLGLPLVWIFQTQITQPKFSVIFQIVLWVIALWSIGVTEKVWKHDDGRIVIDEVVGVFYALVFFPPSVFHYTLGFILFRFFDIFKWGPVKYFDQRPTFVDTLLDDVVAAVFAAGTLFIIDSFVSL